MFSVELFTYIKSDLHGGLLLFEDKDRETEARGSERLSRLPKVRHCMWQSWDSNSGTFPFSKCFLPS